MLAFLLLGVLQGLTEFLPISSSGHLALAGHWLGVDEPGLLLEALLHLATALSVAVYFRRRLWALLRRPLDPQARRWWWALAWGSLPIAVVGLAFRATVEAAFDSPLVVAVGLLWTGSVLFGVERVATRRPRAPESLAVWRLLVIGAAQALAIFPGVSRSGMTIAAALLVGVPRERAAEFSFLLAIPAILGATGLQLIGALAWSAEHLALWPQYAAGAALAAVSGVLAIGVLVRVLQRGRLRGFAYYCWALGLAALVWTLV